MRRGVLSKSSEFEISNKFRSPFILSSLPWHLMQFSARAGRSVSLKPSAVLTKGLSFAPITKNTSNLGTLHMMPAGFVTCLIGISM